MGASRSEQATCRSCALQAVRAQFSVCQLDMHTAVPNSNMRLLQCTVTMGHSCAFSLKGASPGCRHTCVLLSFPRLHTPVLAVTGKLHLRGWQEPVPSNKDERSHHISNNDLSSGNGDQAYGGECRSRICFQAAPRLYRIRENESKCPYLV